MIQPHIRDHRDHDQLLFPNRELRPLSMVGYLSENIFNRHALKIV